MTATSAPCATCPYRRSTPLGVWHPEEYRKLQREDQNEFGGAVFGCHKNDGSTCRGWLADQKRRGVPSIQLRFRLIASERGDGVLLDLYERVDEMDPDMYGSIQEMVEANAGREFPVHEPKARALLAKKRRK